ncbi:MAG: CoA transferase subunit A [Sphingobium sp.]|uniref:CoA transferase subunit A n=1 Tax=Sphingobium sp. CECT 9361 TaxID=2845384 RepID=UPI001E5C13F4|nr:CoA transferase subunit A [Sphingobium sp. CECT 9361]CAH0357045.1 putative succinyl-CoA:3-ketoacid coenzyme A transferase subunit A [Sphingobium sp. CECT 9361]
MANKVYKESALALADLLQDNMTIISGGFGICGIPDSLLAAIEQSGVTGLTIVTNNPGLDGMGVGRLVNTRQIKKLIASYAGENATFAKQYLAGEVELEYCPQGTLVERIRAGGSGVPAFYTPTGVGTQVAEDKETRVFDGREYLLERGIFGDLAVIHAWKGDTEGNLIYRMTARNFNPVMATAAKVTVAEVEYLVEPGEIDPEHIITPGIFVKRIVEVAKPHKHIEKRTVRPRA